MAADPETGELAAPLGSVQLLADSVLGAGARVRRALGGDRDVRDARPRRCRSRVAAREGEPVVLDIGGRHFALPA